MFFLLSLLSFDFVFSILGDGIGSFRARIRILHVENLPGDKFSCLETEILVGFRQYLGGCN